MSYCCQAVKLRWLVVTLHVTARLCILGQRGKLSRFIFYKILQKKTNFYRIILKSEVIGLRKTNIGGEALIEGIMMKGPEAIAIAIRTSDGEILIDKKPLVTLSKRWSFFKAPIIRGAVGIFESMLIGVKALMYSADFFVVEEETVGSKAFKIG